MNDEFESPLDRIIREAREQGAFDNLPGAGQPIRWDDESLTAEDQRLAHHVLKSNGFVPDWVAAVQELQKQYQAARAALERAREAHRHRLLDAAGWQAARDAFRETARQLNLRAVGVNMRAPHERYQLPPFPTDPDAAWRDA
jgi:hypothetical protein